MLKRDEREHSAKAIEGFIGYAFEDKLDFSFDVVVISANGVCVYYNAPCVIEYENYPNNEDSYNLDVWWTQAEKRQGKAPACGYPSENFKSYFQKFSFFPRWDKYLSFTCAWRESFKVCILKRENGVSNEALIQSIRENNK